MQRKNVIPEMFDIRPAKKTGEVDWEKIWSVRRSSGLAPQKEDKQENVAEEVPVFFEETLSAENESLFAPEESKREENAQEEVFEYSVIELGQSFREEYPISYGSKDHPGMSSASSEGNGFQYIQKEDNGLGAEGEAYYISDEGEGKSEEGEVSDLMTERVIDHPRINFWSLFRKFAFVPAIMAMVGLVFFGGKSVELKGRVLGESEVGYKSLSRAIESIRSGNKAASERDFEKAYGAFSSAWEELGFFQNDAFDTLRFVPFLSQAASGKNIIEAGKHISSAGKILNDLPSAVSFEGNPLQENTVSFLSIVTSIGKGLHEALPDLLAAEESLKKVSIEDIPEEKREAFLRAQEKLPILIASVQGFLEKEDLFQELLGGNGPRKYLFLFQNNHEIRPTGGFIGSYGLLDMKDGKIRKFFVDGIFNPDGQLKENIVPPTPIQKVSAGWSLHDSNWFPDFPASAEKAAFFYEKTGGPTVDGVIAITPEVLVDLLRVFGPVEMKEYGVVIDAENFISTVQEEVEVKYDKEENRPKKILSDLAPLLIDRAFAVRDPKKIALLLDLMNENLSERHILISLRNKEGMELLDRVGWSGRMLETEKDYLSVVNTNINGYKTDGVVKESIRHSVKIRDDGSIVDTVRVTRRHTGGQAAYEWWNKVNADYMRVYVPKGSRLLSARGHTREVVSPPLDYEELGFKRDQDIVLEEKKILIDRESGTRIGEEFGKTVFGNWVYVSPGEVVTVEYEYVLPFRFSPGDEYFGYSVLYQKQLGSVGSELESSVFIPEGYKTQWKSDEGFSLKGRNLEWKSDLSVNRFGAAVFAKEAVVGDNEGK